MLVSTPGIVIHRIKYADTSTIVKIYTVRFGIQSYIINGIRSSKSKIKIGFFQPLSLLELVVYHKNTSGLHRIKDCKIAHPLHSIYADLSKNSIALFISEILYKSLKEENPNPILFNFLNHFILSLEFEEKYFFNFHLQFLAEYSRHLGFYPQLPNSFSSSYFDLKQGCFSMTKPEHAYFLSKELSKLIYELFSVSNNFSQAPSLTTHERRALIYTFINYYELHLPWFHDIKSHQVLEQLSQNNL